METKVYLVIKTYRRYDEYNCETVDGGSIVLGAFSTEEKAAEYLSKEKDIRTDFYGRYAIEKYELDKEHSGR